ncbi:MAG: decarboxylating 6-phosphogluconate dehydrogenase [Alphaproteobacteria bacterium]|nr:decarboxylating 6-phosphogluconate dehydrogenase [Alphaproteobacteria bacterium]MBV9695244.1 decarboxylating 6-phosphogluconate dehydrogenase [Alphaproteobacteria bacterium]
MQLGMIGLGRMGANIVRRLLRCGHACVVYDTRPEAVAELAQEGAEPSTTLASLVAKLEKPRAIWLMLPAGEITESTLADIAALLEPGDAVIDGGNSFYKDDIRRAQMLGQRGIAYLDVGTSGGVWGLERGYCMMIGGDKDAANRLDPIFRALAPGVAAAPLTPGRPRDETAAQGYIYCGPNGAGHFVKMIHNGIEYGLMQAYAEGFAILRHANSEELPRAQRFDLDLGDIAEVWRRGSVIQSWLLDLTAAALAQDPELKDYSGIVADSGEGRWTVMAALEAAVPAEVLTASLYARFRSRLKESFADKLLSAMRHGFGGHVEPKSRQ